MKAILFSLVMASSVLAQAALLSYVPGKYKYDGVVLNQTATISDSTLKMDLLGAGVRSKTVLVAQVKVYVIQIFSDNKAAFSRDANALNSLKNANVALKIDMLRTVSADSLSSSLRDATEANGYQDDAEVENLLAIMAKSAEATSGKSLALLMTKKDGKTNVYYEDTKGVMQSFSGSAELSTKILSIWLGTPADDGLAALKTTLLKPVY
jgi:hypothetical protein